MLKFLYFNFIGLNLSCLQEFMFWNFKTKLQNSLKYTCRLINDKLLKRGLYSSTFVDVNDINLYVINTWKDEKTSDKAHLQYTDFVKQVKEMGVNVVIVGGDTEVLYSDPSILQKYTKVE